MPHLKKARAILSMLTQLNIQSPETSDVRVHRKLNCLRQIINPAAQQYPMPGLTSSIAITKLQVGACLEMTQRFCFEYFKRYHEQDITVVFLHNHSCRGDNHVILLLGPTTIDDNLVIARGGDAAYVPDQKHFVAWNDFLQAQPEECVFVDPLLNLSGQACKISAQLTEYCERHDITHVISVKLYHHTLALLPNLTAIEENANKLADKAREAIESQAVTTSHRLFAHRDEENQLRIIKEKYHSFGDNFEKILRNAANKDDIRTVNSLIHLKEKKYISMEIDAAGPESGATALHYAVKKGYEQIIRVLLNAGANVEATDNEGHDAFYYATTESIHRTLLPGMLR